MRVVVLGGAGNFGARIVLALLNDLAIELLVAGRRGALIPGAERVKVLVLDLGGPGVRATRHLVA